MSAIHPPEGLSLEDFETIEAAVSETTRGRWFLAEFARRMRAQETDKVLTALARLEHVMAEARPQLPPPSDSHLAEALTAICERLRDIAWTLRERGVEAELCEAIESEAHVLARLPAPADVLLDRLSALAALEPQRERSRSLTDRIEPLRPAAGEVAPSMPASAPPPSDEGARGSGLADVDALPFREKLQFFA